MKKITQKIVAILVIVMFCVLAWPPVEKAVGYYYTSIVANELATVHETWRVAGSFDTAATNDLAVTERTRTLVQALITADSNEDGNMVLYEVPFGANAIRVRVIGTTADGDFVFELYSGAKTEGNGNASLVKRGTLTCVVGTQLSETATYEFADQIVVTNTTASSTSWSVVSPADNTCAEAVIDIQGDDILCFVPTTVDNAMKILIKYY